jgi:hypothetical protein
LPAGEIQQYHTQRFNLSKLDDKGAFLDGKQTDSDAKILPTPLMSGVINLKKINPSIPLDGIFKVQLILNARGGTSD